MAQMHSTARPRSNAARICTILGFVFAGLAVLFSPLILGVIAVALGVVGAVQGDKPLGWYAAAAGVAAIVLGTLINMVVMGA
ncbi:hypothetical protein AWW66_14105 [Micromonospora rosaria]|uniref:Uncharacterized protein n=1 Tax=Micromonospora rosaria TaxID=47874 RepID=A0A136PS96_9ACTN|nr:hypothetical protein [Micromonospora rosaria]KXK61350.1 hypothetical protein AWW66_14105 [Micromonospora rosaria]